MRVTCATVDDFLANLESIEPSDVFQQRLYVSRTPRRIDEEGTRVAVTLHASAVISLEGGGEYLLDYGENCGVDYEDASQERDGTATAEKIRETVKQFCDERGLKIMPGIVDY